jgi:hypothetical protein
MHFILSEDETFPEDGAVQAALRTRDSEESEAILAECQARFPLKPATTLRAMMPTLLNGWDEAYNTHLYQGADDRFGNPSNEGWAKAWLGYSKDVLDSLVEAGKASTYVILPKRAVARLRWMLLDATPLHAMSPFPTRTVISDIHTMFQDNGEALCDVSTLIILIHHLHPSTTRATSTARYLSPVYRTDAGR